MIDIRTFSHTLIVIFGLVYLLVIGKDLLIPFAFAVLIWFIIKQIRVSLNRIRFIRDYFPEWIKNVTSLLIIIAIINFVINIVYSNFKVLAASLNGYNYKFERLINQANETLKIDVLQSLKVYYEDFDVNTMALSLFNYSTSLMTTIFIVFVYVIFILLEESTFRGKLQKVLPKSENYDETFAMIKKIELSIAKYLGLKTMISLVTSLLSYMALWLIGVDFPAFWAFVIFLFNYIPIIGSYVATLTPVAFSLIQFESFTPPILVFFTVGAIQMTIGNFIDPRIMGKNVNLSPLVIILSLSFWGAIWGVIGMFLSVPLMIMLVITLSKIPRFRSVAILMSKSGNLE